MPKKPKQQTGLCVDEQIRRTLELWRHGIGHAPDPTLSPFPLRKNEPYRLIVVCRSHRLFRRGDVAWMFFSNGQAERWPVYSVSSKGYWVDGYYLKYAGWRGEKQFAPKEMDLIELPGHLTEIPPDSPDVQRWLQNFVESYVQDMPQAGKHG